MEFQTIRIFNLLSYEQAVIIWLINLLIVGCLRYSGSYSMPIQYKSNRNLWLSLEQKQGELCRDDKNVQMSLCNGNNLHTFPIPAKRVFNVQWAWYFPHATSTKVYYQALRIITRQSPQKNRRGISLCAICGRSVYFCCFDPCEVSLVHRQKLIFRLNFLHYPITPAPKITYERNL